MNPKRLQLALVCLLFLLLSVQVSRIVTIYDSADDLTVLYKSGQIDVKYRTDEYRIVLLQITKSDSCSLLFWFDANEIQNLSYFSELGAKNRYMKDGNEEPKSFVFWAVIVKSKGRTREEAHDVVVPKIKDLMIDDPESDCPSVAEG